MSDRQLDRARLVTLTVLVLLPIGAYLAWDLTSAGRFSLKQPWALLGLAVIPLFYWQHVVRARRMRASMAYSSTGVLSRLKRGFVSGLTPLPAILRVIGLTLLIVALARPQTRDRGGNVEVEGIDIILALDLSQSMEADDLQPNRLEAAKKVIDGFISRRRSDRIGLVVFGRDAYTHCPLTLDYGVLRSMLKEMRLGLIDGEATAIGNALGVSLARLRKSDAKSKVVILLTDGESNAGNVAPEQAARYAEVMKVKVFTILMGPQPGSKPRMRRDIFGRQVPAQQFPVNPKLLREIAQRTGGKAYQATDSQALEENFEEILNELDRSARVDVAAVYSDAHRPFAALALLLLLLEAGLGLTRLREFP